MNSVIWCVSINLWCYVFLNFERFFNQLLLIDAFLVRQKHLFLERALCVSIYEVGKGVYLVVYKACLLFYTTTIC
jgi:hypothetical protein